MDREQILTTLKSLLVFLLAGAESNKGHVELSLSGSADKCYLTIIIEGRKTTSLGQEVNKIFVPLYSRKLVRFREELGLASAYGIVRGHGGSISVTPLQDGSRFQIELPCE